MPKTQYDRPRGIPFGISRTFDTVAVPWLSAKRRQLTREDAEIICLVCHVSEILTHDGFRDSAAHFSRLLREHTKEAGELIAAIGSWRTRQTATVGGRARRIVELAMTQGAAGELSYEVLEAVAKREGIRTAGISQGAYRLALARIRNEVADVEKSARRLTEKEIDAILAERGQSFGKKTKTKR